MIAEPHVVQRTRSPQQDRCSPVQRTAQAWLSPLDPAGLRSVMQKLRAWEPFDADALLDDVGTALDEVPPTRDQAGELAHRLRGHLMRLVAIAISGEADRTDTTALGLVERARAIRSQDMPGDHGRAVGHLRRMAWIVNELLERLLATRHLTNVNAP